MTNSLSEHLTVISHLPLPGAAKCRARLERFLEEHTGPEDVFASLAEESRQRGSVEALRAGSFSRNLRVRADTRRALQEFSATTGLRAGMLLRYAVLGGRPHRFLAAESRDPRKLTGIVEADETYVLESRKGERRLDRKARRRGGKASKRGLSAEQVPVLVSADRSGMTVSAVLPAVNADALRDLIEPVVEGDIVLLSDGNSAFPPCAAAMGVRHEALNLSAGERVRNAFHIQTVNSRHSQLKCFLRRYRGIATKYLDNFLRWLRQVELDNALPRTCLANAIDRSCIRFGN